jgi:AraC family L-rhamnose operon regulatory protein RhaS
MVFINKIRLGEAAKRLKELPAASATEIAYQCGFSSAQYFTTVFKRHFGKTPQGYRNEKGERLKAKG